MICFQKIADFIPEQYLQGFTLKRLQEKVSILPETIAEGIVYRVHLDGNLEDDGYEKGLIYLTENSFVKEHLHVDNEETYTLVKGTLSVNGRVVTTDTCKVGESHRIDPVKEDTLVETYKVKKVGSYLKVK